MNTLELEILQRRCISFFKWVLTQAQKVYKGVLQTRVPSISRKKPNGKFSFNTAVESYLPTISTFHEIFQTFKIYTYMNTHGWVLPTVRFQSCKQMFRVNNKYYVMRNLLQVSNEDTRATSINIVMVSLCLSPNTYTR